MVGVAAEMTMDGFRPVMEALSGFTGADRREALEIMGGVAESAARRRLAEDKESPDGDPWPAWSHKYAKTRHSSQSLLEASGALIDSIHTVIAGDDVALVGSPLVYAAIHQFGGEPVGMPNPPRPYIGMGTQDEFDLLEAIERFVWGKLNA